MTRCLSNVVYNAIKHGANADIASRRSGNVVTVTIRDSGPGIVGR